MTINDPRLSVSNGLSRRRFLAAGAAAVPALALGASRSAFAATVQTAGVAPAALAGFDNVLKTYIAERGISCAQLAITKNGKLVLARAYRYSDDPAVPKLTPTSLFRIASLSKHITAVAIMRLAQDGKLSLGTSIATLLGLPTTADARLANVTVWRLLQHTGGWDRDISGDYLYLDHTISRSLGVPLPITREHVIQYASGRPLDFAPGSRYAYSNYGYMLLGMIVEKVSGMAYESYVQQKVLAPVGISRMRLGRTLKAQAAPGEVVYESAQTSRIVTDASGTTVPAPYGGFSMENRGPGGGWLASAVDLARFARILDAPGAVLNATSIGRMVAKPEIGITDNGSWYGAGLWVRQVTGHLNTWHSGGLPGTYTYTARLQDGFTYAALFNRNEESGSPDFDVLSPRINAQIGKVTTWPTTDLFPRYL
ncbi:serine hydrolase domain-containing protein [Nonomuraea jabiensis]|uniref:CubicO group peptidase (Beta-lactamase class C family) n=1 Tax=Nonomuraea jabiensis TaxID=882448 RepID=A0A7W9G8W6_9ACTN|nr:serine hydrolase domain-containing protein [Nonomuraea jabiensis]MBB5779358.1 CubicO group peptidase (beta-lactamase class C family) [Nonomuraea jabiensis]